MPAIPQHVHWTTGVMTVLARILAQTKSIETCKSNLSQREGAGELFDITNRKPRCCCKVQVLYMCGPCDVIFDMYRWPCWTGIRGRLQCHDLHATIALSISSLQTVLATRLRYFNFKRWALIVVLNLKPSIYHIFEMRGSWQRVASTVIFLCCHFRPLQPKWLVLDVISITKWTISTPQPLVPCSWAPTWKRAKWQKTRKWRGGVIFLPCLRLPGAFGPCVWPQFRLHLVNCVSSFMSLFLSFFLGKWQYQLLLLNMIICHLPDLGRWRLSIYYIC